MRANARHAGSIPQKTGWVAQNARFVSANIEFRLSKHEAALLFCHHPPTIPSQKRQEFCYPLQPQKHSQTFLRTLRLGTDRGLGRPLCCGLGRPLQKKTKKSGGRAVGTTTCILMGWQEVQDDRSALGCYYFWKLALPFLATYWRTFGQEAGAEPGRLSTGPTPLCECFV